MHRIATVALLGLLVAAPATGPARADQRFEATLMGHAILPAATFVPPPAGSPPGLALSGRFTGPGNRRVDAVGSLPGTTGPAPNGRPTGLSLPFRGQPIQGFSGMRPVAGSPGSYWVLTDNGFGNRRNSSDALLMIHRIRPDFASGQATVEQTIFLSDPERRVPFVTLTDPSPTRFLTGQDFDLESIQVVADGFWLGDEFGPFLLKVDLEGRVQQVVPTRLEGRELRSPDNPALQLPATPATPLVFETQRSGGFEGMAMTPDGSRLWAMLEKPIFTAAGQPEGRFLRILEFDVARGDWTGRNLRYRFEEAGVSIGDFNMIDDRRALVIERDDGEGDPSLACAAGASGANQAPPACFATPARFKRVYLIDLGQVDAEGFVAKLGHIDLLAIRDPRHLARTQGDRGPAAARETFGFPFFTIESVLAVDAEHILVGNDNNLPFSAGRHLTRADDNEFILLHVPELLRAR